MKLVTIVFCFFIILFTILYQKGGYLHAESRLYLLQYTDKRTLLQKIFDLKRNEDKAYQARELSYVFDMIDSYFIRYSIKMGFPHFYSITYILGIMLILTLSWFIFRLKSTFIFILLAGLFLTSSPTFFTYVYTRSAKLLSGVFFTLIIFVLTRYPSIKNKLSRWLLLIIPLSFLMSISDRQGHFFLLSTTTIFSLLVFYNFFSNKKMAAFYFKIFLLFLTATIISLCYAYLIGPFLIKSISHYSPDLSSFSLNMQTFQGNDPRLEIKNFNAKMLSIFFDSSGLFFETVLNFFGHINKVAAIFMSVLLFIFVINRQLIEQNKRKRKINKEILLILLVSITSLLFILTMFFRMVVKHPPILLPYVRYSYYTFPANVLILLFSGFFVSLLLRKRPKLTTPIASVFLIMLFFNVLAIPGTYHTIKTHMPSQKITLAPQLFKCIKEKNTSIDNYMLPEDDKKMCRILR